MTSQLIIPVSALSVIETKPFNALTYTTQTTLRTISDFNPIPEKLYEEAERLALIPAGAIQYIYTGVNGDETNEFQLEIALPVEAAEIQSDKFALKTFESFRCVSYTFSGPWDAFMVMYDALFGAFYQAGYQTDSAKRVREVYNVVDFETPENCVTDILIGVA
jgi:effector-binding domain-containing protein